MYACVCVSVCLACRFTEPVMASSLIAAKDPDGGDGPAPCPTSVQTSRKASFVIDDRSVDVPPHRARLAPDTSPEGHPRGPGGDPRRSGGTPGPGGQPQGDPEGEEEDNSECRVGECRLPDMIQRLATVQSFTIMCCSLAALTGAFVYELYRCCIYVNFNAALLQKALKIVLVLEKFWGFGG